MTNEYIYEVLIKDWIPLYERPILKSKDIWLLFYKKIYFRHFYCMHLGNIVIHSFTPCNRRYCICKYFYKEDIVDYYRYYYWNDLIY